MQQIAVVGGGAAGMGAAWGLVKAGFAVTLFESGPRLGGHCQSVAVPLSDGRTIDVDVGVCDFNRATFRRLVAFFDELGLTAKPIEQSASFMRPCGATSSYTRAGELCFAEPAVSPERIRAEIARFRRECIEVLEDPTFDGRTLSRYLDHRGYGTELRSRYLYPRAQGCFPMPDAPPEDFPVQALVRFWRIHGLAGPGPADRVVLTAGMHAYAAHFERWLRERGARLVLGARVLGISRRAAGVRVRFRDHVRAFDRVVLAVNANQVLPLLEDVREPEERAFAGIPWQRARVVVHQDARLMPDRRDAWGAFNYVVPEGGVPAVRPTVTFFPNRLAGLPPECPDVFVSLNPFREPAADRVLLTRSFIHPVGGACSERAAARVERIQGDRHTWYCGSYLRSPFVHEEALASGLAVAERLREELGRAAA